MQTTPLKRIPYTLLTSGNGVLSVDPGHLLSPWCLRECGVRIRDSTRFGGMDDTEVMPWVSLAALPKEPGMRFTGGAEGKWDPYLQPHGVTPRAST